MIDGIVLAAGFSRRIVRFKPAIELLGVSILERCIRNMLPVCDRIVVVIGYQYDKIGDITCDIPNVTLTRNESFKTGMFSSVQCGVREVRGERFFIIPGDQPVVKTETFRRLLSVNGDIIIPRYNGKKGHPVLIDNRLIPEILAMSPTGTLRDFIHAKPCTIIDVEDPGIGMDIDTRDDLKRIDHYIREEMN